MFSRRILPAVFGCLVLTQLGTALPLCAQTIRPLVSEFKNKARGKLELVNDAAWPLGIYLEAKSFTLSEAGDVIDAPLDGGIHVKLSAMSLRIPPGQSRFVFYEATADHMPAWFVLYAIFTGFPSRDFKGLNVQVELPHVVYILPNQKLKQTDVRVDLVEFQADQHKIVLDVENTGTNFGRILATELRGKGNKASSSGFALLPGGRRRLELPWNGDEQPDAAVLKSRDFTLEQRLRVHHP
jgi:hypothetical protein